MFSAIWSLVRNWIVTDVPNEMDACLDCNAMQCTDDQYASCPHRLAHAAALDRLKMPTKTEL